MIGYVIVGTNDFDKAVTFYDELLAEVGAERFIEEDGFIAWAVAPDQPVFSVSRPHNGNAATVGNGTMIALASQSTELVDTVYAKAMELGATDEGAPGYRSDSFYAAYFRDLDGNKLNIFCYKMPKA